MDGPPVALTVVDASVVVDALASVGGAGDAARRKLAELIEIKAPAVLRAEVAAAVRRMWQAGELSEARARAALTQSSELRVVEYPFSPFRMRVWELRDVLAVYDAWYVALAEALGSTLLTADRRLAAVPNLGCDVEVVRPAAS